MSLYLTLPPLVAFVMQGTLAAVVLYRNHRATGHRLFALFLICMALWGLIIFGMRTSPDTGTALVWRRALTPIGPLASLAFFHFSILHTRIRARGWLLTTAYLVVAGVTSLSFTDLLVKGMTIDAYGYLPIMTPLHHVVAATSFLFLIMGLVNFVRAYRISSSYEERNSYKYFFIGISFSMVGGLVDLMSVMEIGIPPLGLIGNILFGLLATVAILKYHLLDVHVVIRRSVTYILISFAVAVPYVGIIVLMNRVVGAGNPSLWSSLILLCLLALFLQPFWRRAQRLIDRLFYRGRYAFLKELEDFGQEAHDISNLSQLGSSLVKLIGRALQTPGVYLLLRSESRDFEVVASTDPEGAMIYLGSQSPLALWLQSSDSLLYQRDVSIIPQLQSLSGREIDQLAAVRAELFIPLKSKENELVGLFILSESLSQQPYSPDDERLVLTVASRMAIELENARLYQLERSMRRELERQDEQKTEFLHSVAHELKTPLTAIVSSSELISTEAASASPEQWDRLIGNINRSAWLMDKRVGELLDLAKIQIGTLNLDRELTDIGEPVREVASQVSSIFKIKRQTLDLDIPDTLPPVKLDKDRIEQVLLNLVSNASKFSPTGGLITVRAWEADGQIVVAVQDSASTIAERDKGRLFDMYYRGGDEADRQRLPGLGLGLAISRRIVEQHEGRIWVETEAGKGNTFVFSLPVWEGDEGQTDNKGRTSETGDKLESTNYRR